MRKTLFIIFCWGALILFGAASSFAQSTTQAANAEDLQKQKKAEQVVIRAMRIFGRTLDFEDVYRENFVKDKTVKQNEIKILMERFIEGLITDKKLLKNFNEASSERVFVKINLNFWLMMLCITENQKGFDYFENVIVRKLSRRQRIIYKRLVDDDESKHILKTKTEIKDALSIVDVTERVLKGYLNLKFRKDIQNKTTIHLFREIDPPNDELYVSKFKKFYEIIVDVRGEWLPLSFTVVEESGEMKILSAEPILD